MGIAVGQRTGGQELAVVESPERFLKKYLDEDTYPLRQPGEQRVIIKISPEWYYRQG